VVAIAAIASLVAFSAPAPGHADAASAPFVTEIPNGYRDWQWVSSAPEAGDLNSLGAVLGNDIAIKAYRDGKLPYPTAQSSRPCITATPRQMKTIRSWQGAIIRTRRSHEHSVHGQGLNKVRSNRRLGIWSLPKWQTCRCSFHEALLSLPSEGQRDGPCLHSLCTLIIGTEQKERGRR
jgi:hypothetical protein